VVGADFDPQFLDWLFAKASEIHRVNETAAPAQAVPAQEPAVNTAAQGYQAGSRILSSALASTREDSNKRKAEMGAELANKKRSLTDLKPLSDRLGPARQPPTQPMHGRGFMGRPNNGNMNGGEHTAPDAAHGRVPGSTRIPAAPADHAWLWLLSSATGNDGPDDDDAVEYGTDGANDAEDDGGEKNPT
jgi:hypothetical protein